MNTPEPTGPAESAEPTENPDPTASTGPAEPAGSAEPAAPAEATGSDDAADPLDSADPAGSADPAAEADAPRGPAVGETSLYVRRSRTPTLVFWVALAIAVPALAALLAAPFLAFSDLGGVLGFVLTTAVFVGVPLAAILCLVDALRHRSPGRRRR